jgi:hypothetical protein
VDCVLTVLEGGALPRGALAGQEVEAAVGEVLIRDDTEELARCRRIGAPSVLSPSRQGRDSPTR